MPPISSGPNSLCPSSSAACCRAAASPCRPSRRRCCPSPCSRARACRMRCARSFCGTPIRFGTRRAHRVHRVMRLVAMECPVARAIGGELDRAHLAHRDIGRHFRPARGRRNPAAVGTRDFEAVAVQVDRMVRHRQVAEANPHAVARAHRQRIDAREHARVEGPHVEVRHLVHARRSCPDRCRTRRAGTRNRDRPASCRDPSGAR